MNNTEHCKTKKITIGYIKLFPILLTINFGTGWIKNLIIIN